VAELRAARIVLLAERSAAGIAVGELAADTDPHALARFYGAVIQGTSVQARDGADRAALPEIVDIATAARPSGRATARPGTRPPTADVAEVVHSLVTPPGAWVTGQSVEASGGYRL
jgi:hypothetical protein